MWLVRLLRPAQMLGCHQDRHQHQQGCFRGRRLFQKALQFVADQVQHGLLDRQDLVEFGGGEQSIDLGQKPLAPIAGSAAASVCRAGFSAGRSVGGPGGRSSSVGCRLVSPSFFFTCSVWPLNSMVPLPSRTRPS